MKKFFKIIYSTLLIVFLIGYFAAVFFVSIPCRFTNNNLVCRDVYWGLQFFGLKQNWSQFAPNVPENSSWLSGWVYCQNQNYKVISLPRSEEWSVIDKIIHVRLLRLHQTIGNRRYQNTRAAQDYAKFLAHLQNYCDLSKLEKIELRLIKSKKDENQKDLINEKNILFATYLPNN